MNALHNVMIFNITINILTKTYVYNANNFMIFVL